LSNIINGRQKKHWRNRWVREVELLKQFDPDRELKEEFELASLHDLQKYLDE